MAIEHVNERNLIGTQCVQWINRGVLTRTLAKLQIVFAELARWLFTHFVIYAPTKAIETNSNRIRIEISNCVPQLYVVLYTHLRSSNEKCWCPFFSWLQIDVDCCDAQSHLHVDWTLSIFVKYFGHWHLTGASVDVVVVVAAVVGIPSDIIAFRCVRDTQWHSVWLRNSRFWATGVRNPTLVTCWRKKRFVLLC